MCGIPGIHRFRPRRGSPGPSLHWRSRKQYPRPSWLRAGTKPWPRKSNGFPSPNVSVYPSTDLTGVELGGTEKRHRHCRRCRRRLGFATIRRPPSSPAIVEIRRLGTLRSPGGNIRGIERPRNLTVTCFSKLSRNRGFGENRWRRRCSRALATGQHVGKVIRPPFCTPSRAATPCRNSDHRRGLFHVA